MSTPKINEEPTREPEPTKEELTEKLNNAEERMQELEQLLAIEKQSSQTLAETILRMSMKSVGTL